MKIEPQLKQIDSFTVSGITVRTINRDEADASKAKLGPHWGKFFSESLAEKIPHRLENSSIYGIYSHYESDHHGHYNLTAGVAVLPEAKPSDFTTLNIEKGNYLVFEGKGPMPQVVIDTWHAIWSFFENNPDIERQYKTDFEHYEAADKIAIYIGIK